MKGKIIETDPEFDGFHAFSGWLDSFKTTYGIRDVPITTVLVKGYSLEDVLKMDKLGLFFKTLPQKDL